MSARRAFLLAYLASGAAGLLYEVAWARLLTLHLGHSTAAVSTVLAAFMGGLAVGAALGGRFAPRLAVTSALRAYAVVEIAVALLALLLPFSLQAARPLLAAAYDPAQAGGLAFVLTRLSASLVTIAVPAALMGATFPLAVRWYVRSPERAGRETGALYALNTVGAAAGAACTGFILLPQLGLRGTTLVGITLNVVAAAIAWWAARREPSDAFAAAPATARKAGRRQAKTTGAPVAPRPLAAAAALALSGFIALTYEVTWTRLLALVIGPTTYAFGLMLAAFIGGLAIGAALGARWATRANPMAGLGATFMVTAIGGLLIAGTASTLPLQVAEMVARPGVTFGSVLWVETASLVALLLPTTIALGAAFPIAIAAATGPGRDVAADAALVYAGNTLGAIAGSLTSGFLLIPWLGLRATVVAAAIAAVAGSAAIVLAGRTSRAMRLAVVAVGAAALAGAIAMPGWNRALLSSGAYKYAPYLRGADMETTLGAGTLLYYAEGAAGTVTVRRTAGTTALAIDGKVDASNTSDMLTQKLLGHLPALLHPGPKRAGIIGLGSGVTLGAVLRHPIERADVIEISPEVVEASAFFARENLNALADPRTRLILGDARTHLTLGSGQYDLIISEPSNPWMAGVASLFTREFFETLRARLAPGGIVCQWAHTYDISEADLRSIIATFLAVFPDGSLWLVGESDVLLISNDGPIESLLPRIASAWARPGVAADLESVRVKSPFELVTQLVAGGPALARFAGGAVIQTDDRMALEFSAPKGIVGAMRLDNTETLRKLAADAAPEPVRRAIAGAGAQDWKRRGLMFLAAESFRSSYDDLARAASLDPADRETLDALETAAAGAGRIGEAMALTERLARQPGGGAITARLAGARLLAASDRSGEALALLAEANALSPDNPDVLIAEASIYADAGDVERLGGVLNRLQAVAPDRPDTLYFRGTAALLAGRGEESARLAEQVLARDPRHARAHNLLGAARAGLLQLDLARRAFQTSADLSPRDPTPYVNLGSLELLQAANAEAAAGYFSEALSIDPASTAAREGLAQSLDALGQHERARRLRAAAPHS